MSAAVLQLNFSYEPLSVVTVQRAVRLLFAGKAEVVAAGDRTLHSESLAFPLPSVIRMLYYIRHRRKAVALTKKNLLLRDDYRCGYCLEQGGPEMTVDHVQPRSRGGASSWTNLVASCGPCNARKRDRTPAEAGMHLARRPHVPSWIPWVVVRKHTAPAEWAKYLGLYGISIEERVG